MDPTGTPLGSSRTSHLRPHERLLLVTCRRDAPEELTAEVASRIASPVPWESVVETAERHDVLGLVLSTLEQSPAVEELPEERARRILGSLRLLSRQSLLWEMERERLAEVFSDRGLDPVWLKGGALRGTVYPNPVERQIGDFDLLLAGDELEPAARALESAGYESPLSEEQRRAITRHHYHHRLTHPGGFVVELHWALTQPSDPYRLDADALRRRSRPQAVADGLVLRAPSAEDMLLHCAAQNFEGAFGRLRRLVDLDRIAGSDADFDWTRLEQAARRAGLDGTLAFCLQLTRSVLGTRLPPDVITDLAPSPSLRLHTALMGPIGGLMRQEFSRRPAAAWLLRFWLASSWSVRGDLLVRRLAGTDQPLEWLWEGQASPDEHDTAFLAGPRKVAKALLYQIWLYLKGLGRAATSAGRRELGFWS